MDDEVLMDIAEPIQDLEDDALDFVFLEGKILFILALCTSCRSESPNQWRSTQKLNGCYPLMDRPRLPLNSQCSGGNKAAAKCESPVGK